MYKSKLQELCHCRSWSLPEYATTKEGLDHNPRFTATVVVGGVTFVTTDQCRSSKEAQNEVAKLAFHYFSSVTATRDSIPHLRQQPFPGSPIRHLPIPPYSDLSAHYFNLDNRCASGVILQPSQQKYVETLQANETSLSFKDGKTSKEMLHLYKNRLQNYAQKRNLTLPIYSCETEGPPHARRFKSRVTFNGTTHETSEFYSSLKEAEHAAAKIAFELLALDEVPEDDGLFKSLLQEWAQRESLHFPVYETTKLGPPHLPTFVSTVKIGAEVFHGQEAKTKKQAEMSSAKAAYIGLTECQESKNLGVLSPGGHIKASAEITSRSLQSFASDDSQQGFKPGVSHIIHKEQAYENKGEASSKPTFCSSGNLKASSSNRQPIVTEDMQRNVKQHAKLVICDEQEAEGKDADKIAKGYTSSASLGTIYPHLQDPFPSTSEDYLCISISPSTSEDYLSSSSIPLEDSFNSVMESDVETPAAATTIPCKKILVYPSKSKMRVPDGATTLPFSNEKWVAVRVDKNQSK